MAEKKPGRPPGTVDGRRWWALGVVCVATFMLLLDITIVNVALPDIARDLGASFSALQWVIDAYALSLAAFMLTAGSLADRFGRRRIFTAGLVIFTASSALCGFANSPTFLDLARGLQGIGGAAMFATSLALLAASFQGKERGTAFGLWGATIGGAVAIGPLVGGLLTQGSGWQSIFFINLPIGIAAVAVTLARVRESRNPDAGPVDVPGVLTFCSGLFLLIFALVRGNSEGWGSALILGALIGAAVLLAAFVVIEVRTEQPMLDLSLFRKPAFTGAAITAFAVAASMFSMFLYLTLYLQNVLGFSPLQAGLRFLPITLLSFLVAPIAGRLSARLPVRWMIGAGLALVGAGLLLMGGLDAGSEWTALLAGFVIAGAGIGLLNPPLASTAVGVVEPARSGMASGINNTFRQIGVATGTAGLGAIFEHLINVKVPAAAARAGPAVQAAAARVPRDLLQTGNPGPLNAVPGGRAAYLAGFTTALDTILVMAAVIAFTGAILSAIMIRPRDFVPAPELAQEAPGMAEPEPAPAPA